MEIKLKNNSCWDVKYLLWTARETKNKFYLLFISIIFSAG